ncbi:MAG: Gldg family protein [Acidobacteriota bacterium]
MFQKVVDQFAYLSSIALLGALVRYTVSGWDLTAQTLLYGGLGLMAVYLIVHRAGIQTALRTRAARYGGMAGATGLLVLGILVLANFLSVRHNRRIDLTENQLYSLSEQSLKVIDSLPGDIQIIGFFGGDSGRLRFEDLVRQYRSPRIEFQVVNPRNEPGLAAQYGITREGQVAIVSGDEQVLVDDLSEEKITNAIIKITRDEEKVVYFLQGHGERDIQDGTGAGLSLARQEVENQNYRVESYNLAQQSRLPEDATIMVSAGPRVDFLSAEITLLKSYLAMGGKLLLLVDPQTDLDLGDFLAEYGLGLANQVLIDASFRGQLLGAAAPVVADYADHPMTRELSGSNTFFPGSQHIQISTSPLEYRITELLSTSAASWAEVDFQGEDVAFDPGKDTEGPLPLAAVATRTVDVKEDPTVEVEGNPAASENVESRLVLFGDSDFASNAYFNEIANGDLFLMTVGWLAEEDDLLAIRPKDPENRRINVTLGQSRMIFWASVILFPLATLILGTAIWLRRK